MPTFYRIISRLPLSKPTLVIGSMIPSGVDDSMQRL
ncbi:MAG: hypothetical protein JWL69_3119 [Phycisphaerales bacterium]|nr:hypothetical protein [Phycisphaerales bacterium]